MPELTVSGRITILRSVPPEFCSTAMQEILPYFGEHYGLVLVVFALLFVKELIFRLKEAPVVLMWLAFAFLTFVIPVLGRIFFTVKLAGFLFYVLAPFYLYYPCAAVSIVLGLLLRLPPFMEKRMASFPGIIRMLAFALAAALLIVLNRDRVGGIRREAVRMTLENRCFYLLVREHNTSMMLFLRSANYSPDEEYYFEDSLVASPSEYRSSFSVMKHNIFNLCFPDIKNVRFVDENECTGNLFVWTPNAVTPKQGGASSETAGQ